MVKDGGSVNITTTSGTITLKNVGDGGDSYYISSESGYLIDITLNGGHFKVVTMHKQQKALFSSAQQAICIQWVHYAQKTDSWRN